MARYDVHRACNAAGYLLDCQADLLRDLNTRFVVPLLPVGEAPIAGKKLNPIFLVEDVEVAMVTQYAASVTIAELGPIVHSLSDQDRVIMNALDMLLTGY